ncbi:hypothetical protein [Methylobacterium sp. NFXW15]|uniref:hypothetical protein n=1 Tax=Methylobacterium sp. NFXW15 TaxID=2819512 RepID=UPI003CF5FD54
MNDLFEMPDSTQPQPPVVRTRTPKMLHALSERVKVPASNGKTVEYARLSDADHHEVREVIRSFYDFRDDIRIVLDQPSGLFGSRGKGSAQTFWDVLVGMYEKMHKRHPILHARVGQDLTIKQLDELNRLIDALNKQFGGDLAYIPVP